VIVAELKPRRHDPPHGWDGRTFEALTDALATALVATYKRLVGEERSA
jgi:hypothetical protein